jgi:hypothetical protein
MEPVRIKYYGLLSLTRPTYVVLQSIALFLCVALAAVGLLAMLLTGTVLPHLPAEGEEADFLTPVLVSMFWIGLLALLAESVETYVMLRRFAHAEAEQQAKLATLDIGEPAPSDRHSTAVQLPPDERPNTNIKP